MAGSHRALRAAISLQHPEHLFALLTDLLAKPVVALFILIDFLFGERLDALGISGVGQFDEYAIVIARARAELEILYAARHGLGTGDADNIDSLARKRDVAIDRTLRLLRVRIAHQHRHQTPISRQLAGVQICGVRSCQALSQCIFSA